MRSAGGLLLIVTLFGSICSAQTASRAERQAALGERPLLLGVSVDWYPDSYPVLPEVYWETLEDRLRDLGATVTPVEFDWSRIEISPGEFDFRRADGEVERAMDAGLAVVGRILGTPAWANTVGRPSSRHFPRLSAESDFALFCERVAFRYSGRVDRYQFQSAGGGTDAAQYLHWLGSCRAALRRGHPAAVLALGVRIADGAEFLESVYAAGQKGLFDGVAIEALPAGGNGSGGSGPGRTGFLDREKIEKIRAVMVARGDEDTPVWITGSSCPVDVVGLPDQAECVIGILDFMVRRDWITLGILTGLADPPGATAGLTGLCEGNLVPRPAYRAFARYVNAPAALSTDVPELPRFVSPEGKQLVANPGFEEGDGEDFVSWTRWGDRGSRNGDAAGGRDLVAEPYRGERFAMVVGEEHTFRGGLYQVFEVTEGTWLAATVRTQVIFTKVPPKARIGMDLLGGIDPDADTITWSPWYSPHDPDTGWVEIGLEYPARVDGERATVFLEWSQPVAAGRSAVGFDEVYVRAVER